MSLQVSARSISAIRSSNNKQIFNQNFSKNSTVKRPPSTRSLLSKSQINSIKNQNIIKKVNEQIEKLNIEVNSPEITKTQIIHQDITKIFEFTGVVIRDNESVPSVFNLLTPALKKIKRSYEKFQELSTELFTTLAVIQNSSFDKNQVLSTSSIRVSRDVFESDWKDFCSVIQNLFNTKPPPQSKEIKIKINSILSSLQYIQITNENRKNPAQHLTEYISYVRSLCNQLYQNIINLFSQQIFPNFESNILASYISNVRTFVEVINNSFSNEFMQSGLLFSDLSRLKSNIYSDCNDIIKSLKLAFHFSHQLYEIKCMNEDLNIKIDEILRKLSGPYIRVFIKDGEVSTEDNPNQQLVCLKELDLGFSSEDHEEEEEKETLESFIRKSRESRGNDSDLYYEAIIKVKNFLKSIYTIIQKKPIVTGDVWEDLHSGVRSIQEFKDRFDEQTKIIKKHEATIKQLNDAMYENEANFKNQKEMYKDKLNEQKIYNEKLLNDYQYLSSKYEELENVLKEKNRTINSLINRGDPLVLRKALIDFGSLFTSQEEKKSFQSMNDQELIEKIRESQSLYISSNQRSIQGYQKSLNEISDKIHTLKDSDDILKSLDNLFLESRSKEKEINELNQKLAEIHQIVEEKSIEIGVKGNQDNNLAHQLKQIINKYESQIEHDKEKFNELDQTCRISNENHQKELMRISDQLHGVILQTNGEIEANSNESINQYIKVIQDKLLSFKEIEQSKTNQNNILTKDINQTLKRLYYLIQIINSNHPDDPIEFVGTNVKEQSLTDAVDNIELMIQHHEQLINKLNLALGNIENELITIDIRLKGILGLKIKRNVEKQTMASLISSIYDHIEQIQDQTEHVNPDDF